MDLVKVLHCMLRVCGTVTREEGKKEHMAVTSPAPFCACACPRACPRARPAHASAVQVGNLLEMMGYVRAPRTGDDKRTINLLSLQDHLKSGEFWATGAQIGLNLLEMNEHISNRAAWGTLSTLPMYRRGFDNFGTVPFKLVFCIVAAAFMGLEHQLSSEEVVTFGKREITKHEEQWKARLPCAIRALAVSYRPSRLQVIFSSPKGKPLKVAERQIVSQAAKKASAPAPIPTPPPPALDRGITQVRFGLACCAGQRIICSRCCSLSWRSRRRRSWRVPSS